MVNSILNSIFIITFIFFIAHTSIINVPADQPSIQAGIDAASNGDTVLVAPETYYENINFNGKNIVVAGYYIFSQDFSDIESTVINGSLPVHNDTASCVLIISGEDSTAILEGFTLTGGTGTKWLDEHGAGRYFEGGGILITLSSPTIKHNIIINNEAARTGGGTISAGGGGIRCGDGFPRILNNLFINNKGMYGAGLVLNYTGAIVRNNVFFGNKVYQAVSGAPTFGGGAIWCYNNFNNLPKIIENNTIVANSSAGGGGGAAGLAGGILVWATSVELRNNIVWDNTQLLGGQINLTGGATANITYNNIDGGWSGTGNINLPPLFADSTLYLSDNSPCVDAGNPDTAFNDPEDPGNPGYALFPAKGTVRNDIGAYGGPQSFNSPPFITGLPGETIFNYPAEIATIKNYPNPFNPFTTIEFDLNQGSHISLILYNITGQKIKTLFNGFKTAGTHRIKWNGTNRHGLQISSGVYIYLLVTAHKVKCGKMLHNR